MAYLPKIGAHSTLCLPQAFITSVRLLREREVPLTHRLPAICLLEMHREKGSLSLSLSLGQTEKNSVRAYVFRFASHSDIARRSRHVSNVPTRDSCTAAI